MTCRRELFITSLDPKNLGNLNTLRQFGVPVRCISLAPFLGSSMSFTYGLPTCEFVMEFMGYDTIPKIPSDSTTDSHM